MKYFKAITVITLIACVGLLSSCTGRRKDTMVPTGETVEVVIPEGAALVDSTVAAGNVGNDSVVSAAEEVIL